MKNAKKDAIHIGARIGALFGVIVFIIFGLVPGFYFGSSASILLLNSLFSGPVHPTIFSKIFIVIGIALGMFCSFSVSIIIGALAGTALGYISDLFATTNNDE